MHGVSAMGGVWLHHVLCSQETAAYASPKKPPSDTLSWSWTSQLPELGEINAVRCFCSSILKGLRYGSHEPVSVSASANDYLIPGLKFYLSFTLLLPAKGD